ncbi:hypothetical protein K3728_18245 [Rhodobacteraceae bacterium M385]|nr:hypothetical protein K3728_18245 [Rhodobacteraceae bacterium M385]
MTESAVHILYTRGAHFVHTAAVAALALAAPASAQIEGGFEAFQARCLTPMLEVRETDVTGLTRVPHRAAWETWRPDDAAWELQRALPGAVVQYCAINGPIEAEVAPWAEAAVASGDYIRIDREPYTLQTTTLREPRLEIEIDREATPMHLTVIETNLES